VLWGGGGGGGEGGGGGGVGGGGVGLSYQLAVKETRICSEVYIVVATSLNFGECHT